VKSSATSQLSILEFHLEIALEDDLAALLGASLINNGVVALLPGVDDESLSRVDMGGEANASVLDFVHVVVVEVLLQCSNRHSVGAKSVQDGNTEASPFGLLGIHMQWVGVAGESVDEGRVFLDVHGCFVVGAALGGRGELDLVGALVAEPANAANEKTRVDLSEDFIGNLIIDFGCYDQDGSGALILHVENILLDNESASRS